MHADRGENKAAVASLETIYDESTCADYNVLYTLGVLYVETGAAENARKVLSRAVSFFFCICFVYVLYVLYVFMFCTTCCNTLGVLYIETGAAENARKVLSRAVGGASALVTFTCVICTARRSHYQYATLRTR
jgi:hypothetical protein